jgi:N-acetylmuramoyl-L-alanine amidase
MRKLNKILLTATLALSLAVTPTSAGAASYTVQEGDTFQTIAEEHGVTLSNLQIANNRSGNDLLAGETINIPNSVSQADKNLLAHLVNAEAKGEPYAGKVAVATVVLNRVDSAEFPDTVREVIYEKVAGKYAFSPVLDGSINEGYTEEDMKAVDEAVAFRGQGSGSLYFYNPDKAESAWVFSRDTILKIGGHRFAR